MNRVEKEFAVVWFPSDKKYATCPRKMKTVRSAALVVGNQVEIQWTKALAFDATVVFADDDRNTCLQHEEKLAAAQVARAASAAAAAAASEASAADKSKKRLNSEASTTQSASTSTKRSKTGITFEERGQGIVAPLQPNQSVNTSTTFCVTNPKVLKIITQLKDCASAEEEEVYLQELASRTTAAAMVVAESEKENIEAAAAGGGVHREMGGTGIEGEHLGVEETGVGGEHGGVGETGNGGEDGGVGGSERGAEDIMGKESEMGWKDGVEGRTWEGRGDGVGKENERGGENSVLEGSVGGQGDVVGDGKDGREGGVGREQDDKVVEGNTLGGGYDSFVSQFTAANVSVGIRPTVVRGGIDGAVWGGVDGVEGGTESFYELGWIHKLTSTPRQSFINCSVNNSFSEFIVDLSRQPPRSPQSPLQLLQPVLEQPVNTVASCPDCASLKVSLQLTNNKVTELSRAVEQLSKRFDEIKEKENKSSSRPEDEIFRDERLLRVKAAVFITGRQLTSHICKQLVFNLLNNEPLHSFDMDDIRNININHECTDALLLCKWAVFEYFSLEEMIGRNMLGGGHTGGANGTAAEVKKPFNEVKVNFIKEGVFAIYPQLNEAIKKVTWLKCVEKVNTDVRYLFKISFPKHKWLQIGLPYNNA